MIDWGNMYQESFSFDDIEGDYCCESVNWKDSSSIDTKLLLSSKTKELLKKYTDDPKNPYFDYRNETRKKYGELPKDIFDNLSALVKLVFKSKEYKEYKKFLDILCSAVGYDNNFAFMRNIGRNGDILLEYQKIGQKRPMTPTVRLFHTSNNPNLKELAPKFKSVSNNEVDGHQYEMVEAIWPEPRVYFGYNTVVSRLGGDIKNDAHPERYFNGEQSYCYEYTGSKSLINGIFNDMELRGGNAVYVNTDKPLPVKRITYEEYKNAIKQESFLFDDIENDYFVQESAIDRVKSKIADIDEEIAELEDMLKKKPNSVSIEDMLEDAKKRKRRWEGELEDLLDDDDNRVAKDTKPKPSIRYDSSSGMNVFTINKDPQNDAEFNKIYDICKKMKEAVNNNQWSSFESNASAFFKNINISDYESRRMMLNTVDRNCVQIWFTNAEKKIDPNNMRFFHCSHNSSITELKPTHMNAGKTIVYPCNAVFFIAISKSDNIDRILSNFKMYGGNVYEYTPSSSDIIYTDSKERRENGIPAVFIKTNKPLKVNKYQTKTVSESFSFDDIEDDYFVESTLSYDNTLEVCKELYDEWSNFEYGIPIDGELTTVTSAKEFDENYRFLSPDDFEKYGGGVCWDFIEWGAKFLRSKGIQFHQYYLQTDTPPNYDTHTFIICHCGDKFVYPECAFSLIASDLNGVGTFNSLPEIYNYIASKMFECNGNKERFKGFKFSIYEYTQTPNYGCTCQEYMDFMKEHSHLVFKGVAHPIDHVNGQDALMSKYQESHVQESKLSTSKRDKLKDSEFGIPEKRTFPLNDKNHVEAAVRMFPHADDSDKKELAKRIIRKAHEFGMDTSKWESLNKYIQEADMGSITLSDIPYTTATAGYKPTAVNESDVNPFALFDKVPLNDFIINRYKSKTDDMAIGLKHLRMNDRTKGFMWLNQQDEVVGYVAVEQQDIGPFIIALELSPKYQGRGLGKALLEFAENYLGGRYLSVSKKNERAFEMYKSCGWNVYDETPKMYFMKKDDTSQSNYQQDNDNGSDLPEGITLRPATEDDIPNMFKWKLESLDKRLQTDPKTIKFIENNSHESVWKTRMIMYNNDTIGMLTTYTVDDGYWYIDEIYIIEEYRGRGIGRALLEKEISEHDKLSLKVAKDNTRAFKLYQSLGFEVYDETDYSYNMRLDKNKHENQLNNNVVSEYSNNVRDLIKKREYQNDLNKRADIAMIKRVARKLIKTNNRSTCWLEMSEKKQDKNRNNVLMEINKNAPESKGASEQRSYDKLIDQFNEYNGLVKKHGMSDDQVSSMRIRILNRNEDFEEDYGYSPIIFKDTINANTKSNDDEEYNITCRYIYNIVKVINDSVGKNKNRDWSKYKTYIKKFADIVGYKNPDIRPMIISKCQTFGPNNELCEFAISWANGEFYKLDRKPSTRFIHFSRMNNLTTLEPNNIGLNYGAMGSKWIYPTNRVYFWAINRNISKQEIFEMMDTYGNHVYEYIPKQGDVFMCDRMYGNSTNDITAVFITTDKSLPVKLVDKFDIVSSDTKHE